MLILIIEMFSSIAYTILTSLFSFWFQVIRMKPNTMNKSNFVCVIRKKESSVVDYFIICRLYGKKNTIIK